MQHFIQKVKFQQCKIISKMKWEISKSRDVIVIGIGNLQKEEEVHRHTTINVLSSSECKYPSECHIVNLELLSKHMHNILPYVQLV